MASEKNMLQRVWDFFCSLKLTLSLFIILAVTATVGTVIPQNAAPAEYLRLYQESTYRVIHFLGFDDLYHAWWFVCLIVLLCLNVLACSIRNFPRTWKTITRETFTLEDDQIKSLPFVETKKVQLSLNEAREKLFQAVKKHFGTPRETKVEDTYHLFVERGKYSRLGVYVTHLSILVILAGGLMGSLFGLKGFVNITEGKAIDQIMLLKEKVPYKLGFQVRCDSFNVDYYPSGAPKDYKSALTILEDGKPVLSKTIEVNHPLSYKGLRFFQSSFGSSFDQGAEVILLVRKRDGNDPGKQYRMEVGKGFELPEAGLKVTLNQFVPDFMLGENRAVFSRSTEPNNPAVELRIAKEGATPTTLWVFKNFPDFHGGKGFDYDFQFLEFAGKEYTGLEVVKDPGVSVVWTGCILMLLGVLAVFFLSHQKLWVRLRGRGNKTELVIAGVANKNPLGFEKDFIKLKSEIERKF